MFCPACGASQATGTQPTPTPTPGAPPPYHEFVSEISELEGNIERRRETDLIMSFPKWIVLSIITLGIAGIVMFYRLIKRRAEHFKRQRRIVEAMETIMRAKASKHTDITPEVTKMSLINKGMRDEEGEKSAALWTILSIFTGIGGLYVWYFLMRDIYTHSNRQRDFVDEFVKVMSKLGVDTSAIATSVKAQYQVPKRSFAKYLVLTIVTIGIFGIYWAYVIFKDWNDHFKTQWLLEDEIQSGIKRLP